MERVIQDQMLPKGMEFVSGDELRTEWKQLGDDGFRRKYAHPFLVLMHAPSRTEEWVELKTLGTEDLHSEPLHGQTSMRVIIPVAKTDRNVFESMVTVGRATNNDIIMREPRISKLHAAFLPAAGTRWQVIDMGSANGTHVNSKQIAQKKAVDLTNGDMVAFWHYIFVFLTPEGLIERLKMTSELKDAG